MTRPAAPAPRSPARPQPRPGILDIAPYKPGAAKTGAPGPAHKLSSNESALGPSPAAIDAFRTCGEDLHLYPDGAATALREKLGQTYNLDPARIVCGAGSDDLLQLIARAYAGGGENVIQTAHGFLVYAIAAKSCGADVKFAPETRLTANVDAILELVDEGTRIVFLANPNNPTGTYLPDTEVRRLREGLREDILLVLDAAYAEYVEAPDYAAGAALVEETENTVMTRTFSKIYGLGGLRLGWGYFPDAVADAINRIRGPFNVSAPAIAAGVAALEDQAFVERNRAHNRAERDFLAQQLGRLGLDFTPSVANFLLVELPETPGRTAADALAFLKARGVLVREMSAYGLPSHLRVSVGATAANRALIDGLGEFLSDD